MSKQYQPETTHVDPNSTIVKEYMFSGGVWYCFTKRVDGWIRSYNQFSWHSKNLIPIAHESTQEQDPSGIGQHESGAKLDSGKPMSGRLLGMFGNALYAVSEVGTFGANKYTEGGWQHVEDGFKRYDDAGMRHLLKRGMGEEIDPDSGMLHLAHEAWNSLAKLELYIRQQKGDEK